MKLDINSLGGEDFKRVLKVLQADQKRRGPTGELKLKVTAAGIDALIGDINKIAEDQKSNATEVLDACLRGLKLPYHLSSNERTKTGDEATEVSIGS